MSFEIPKGINGWLVTGADDLELLERQPDLFSAEKNGNKLTIRYNILAEGVTVNAPPVGEQKYKQEVRRVADWRLRYNGYDVAIGRSVSHVLEKAINFMKRN